MSPPPFGDFAASYAGREPAAVRKRIEAMEHLLEGLFRIPGTNRKIGLDVILDLIPVGGDAVGAAMGAWMVWEARNLGMSKAQMARMFGNVGMDFLLGLIPVVGAVPDMLFRSNTRNLKIIKRHLDKHHPASAMIEHGELAAPRVDPGSTRYAHHAQALRMQYRIKSGTPVISSPATP